MRVSSNQTQLFAINAMLEQQAKLSKTQQQIATGRKIFRPSDDPVAASKVVDLRDKIKLTEQYQANIDTGRARLTITEGVLSSVTEVIHRIRELSIQANNASQTNETRGYIAEETAQLLDELLSLANMTDSTGEYLFAGSKGKFAPFSRNDHGSFDYHGDESQRFIQIGPGRRIAASDSGTDVFRAIRDGNGTFTVLDSPNNKGTGVADPGSTTGEFRSDVYVIAFQKTHPHEPATYGVMNAKGEMIVPPGKAYLSGDSIEFQGAHTFIKGEPADGDFFIVRPSLHQDMFTSIQRFVDTLEKGRGSAADTAKLNNEVNRTILSLDAALEIVLETRASIGARLNALDSQKNINDAYRLQVREILSGVEDLDYGEAVSRLNLQLTGLEASQKSFTRVQGLSIFNYL